MNKVEFIFILLPMASAVIYTIMILFFTYGWNRLRKSPHTSIITIDISVIVPLRNEQEHIGKLLQSLLSQEYPEEHYEIIVINDHSTDNSVSTIDKHDPDNRIILFHLEDGLEGKKCALQTGIRHATGKLIATIDADCCPGKSWLKSIAATYGEHNYKMMSAAVAITKPGGVIGKFQALELLSLVGCGAGAIGIGMPIMCNGANLIYEKSAFEEVDGFKGNEHISGGDDIFLLEKFKRRYTGKQIGFIKNKKAIVYTSGTSDIREFFNQRIRWVSKSPAYRDPGMIFTALVVLIFNLGLLISLAWAFFSFSFFYVFAGLFLLKCIVDFPVLWKITGFTDQRHLLTWYLPFQLIYFIFISFSGIIGNLIVYKWKGR